MNRGTSSTKHWKNNFQYGLKEVDFLNLPALDVDETDGLNVAGYIDLAVHEVDSSESSDSDDDDDADDNSASLHGDHGDLERNDSAPIVTAPGHVGSPRRKRRKRRGRSRPDDHNPVVFVADTVREVGDVVIGATTSVVDATTGLLTAAVAHTPIIRKTVKAFVHR